MVGATLVDFGSRHIPDGSARRGPHRSDRHPWFSREIPPTWWSWPTLLVVGVLSGLVTATYVAQPSAATRRRESRWGILGGGLSFFAVGCPVCNKIVLIALGSIGAMRYFEPVQPILALASIVLLGWALSTRIRREPSCPTTSQNAATPATTDR